MYIKSRCLKNTPRRMDSRTVSISLMMAGPVEGVQNGEITAVIVKDMSRVGRDHLQVGMFTDVLFPEKDFNSNISQDKDI